MKKSRNEIQDELVGYAHANFNLVGQLIDLAYMKPMLYIHIRPIIFVCITINNKTSTNQHE